MINIFKKIQNLMTVLMFIIGGISLIHTSFGLELADDDLSQQSPKKSPSENHSTSFSPDQVSAHLKELQEQKKHFDKSVSEFKAELKKILEKTQREVVGLETAIKSADKMIKSQDSTNPSHNKSEEQNALEEIIHNLKEIKKNNEEKLKIKTDEIKSIQKTLHELESLGAHTALTHTEKNVQHSDNTNTQPHVAPTTSGQGNPPQAPAASNAKLDHGV